MSRLDFLSYSRECLSNKPETSQKNSLETLDLGKNSINEVCGLLSKISKQQLLAICTVTSLSKYKTWVPIQDESEVF